MRPRLTNRRMSERRRAVPCIGVSRSRPSARFRGSETRFPSRSRRRAAGTLRRAARVSAGGPGYGGPKYSRPIRSRSRLRASVSSNTGACAGGCADSVDCRRRNSATVHSGYAVGTSASKLIMDPASLERLPILAAFRADLPGAFASRAFRACADLRHLPASSACGADRRREVVLAAS